jgi:tetratricopeptide (TPR) repeat protein
MSDRLLVDVGADRRVTVGVQRGDELPDVAGASFDLAWPLSGEDLDELRWYLEDYLRAPYGADSARGERIAASLERWGVLVFESVFGAGPARDAYVAARRGAAELEVVFRSPSAAVLGLPWELMRDPARASAVALDLVGVSRSLRAAALGESFAVEGDVLRVLMVISRPAGTRDVGYRMVARPLLERLEAVRGRVELVVLRPPTLDALQRTLAREREAGRPFQIVHFDGHGVLAGRRAAAGSGGAPLWFDVAGGEGLLVFEKPEGGPDPVPADSLAHVLKQARVPVVVLNACQSGAVGKELEAAVATRLLAEGVSSVVAMAYSVYAVAAAEFMAAFYERLFAGDRVSAAVGAGRRRLAARPGRPSPKGEMALADWVIPVHYQRRPIHFPALATARSVARPLETMLDDIREHAAGAGDGTGLDPIGTFVGRDGLFYELEVACRTHRAVVLHGPGGTGKTELAKAFGRWSCDTAGAQLVIFHSFEPGVASFGLDGVLAAIGLRAFGAQFARLDPGEREDVILTALREHPLMLIWDNFESVFAMPDPTGVTPPLDEQQRARLARFVAAIAAGGRSALLITSRTPEGWLGDSLARLPVGGLNRDEAVQYADVLLSGVPASRERRAHPAFGRLLDALDGHPLSMRLVLPHVANTSPQGLLDALQGRGELPAGHETGRLASLQSCVGYSFEHLNPEARRLLTAVSLFHGVVDVDVLTIMSRMDDVPARFAGIDRDSWAGALDAAANIGLLTSIGAGMYRIHPALPAYLAEHWHHDERDQYDGQHAQASHALLTAYADFGNWLLNQMHTGDAGLALRLVELQRRTLGYLLGSALGDKHWQQAHAIAQPLDEYFTSRGLDEEARAWVDRARQATENPDGTAPDLTTPAGELWGYFVGSQANREMRQGRLASAERTYQELVEALRRQTPSPEQQRNLAAGYHQLGMVAQDRGRLDDAEDWYRQSLTINEELGNRSGMATTYHQLGMVAQGRGRLDDAEDWYRQSLTIKEELGNRPGMASSYHQLGIVAQDRGRLDDAEDWYRQSLTIKEELGNRPGMADTLHTLGSVALLRGHLDEAEDWYHQSLRINEELTNRPRLAMLYHQLGIVAQDRGRPDDAEDWYRQSLTINEELGNRRDMATSYHQLGRVAQDRGRLDDAEDWYRQSLTINEELGNRRDMATTYHQLGIVAQERGRLDDAEDWYRQSLTINDELGSRPRLANNHGQLGLLAEARGRPVDALEWTVRCVTLFDEFPHPATGPAPLHLARLTAQLGLPALEACWQAVTGDPLPSAVRDHVIAHSTSDPKE